MEASNHIEVKELRQKRLGYVGLRNQGATCYLNSLIQGLYFTSEGKFNFLNSILRACICSERASLPLANP
jgi:ubiquitin C-terminal hydrolase